MDTPVVSLRAANPTTSICENARHPGDLAAQGYVTSADPTFIPIEFTTKNAPQADFADAKAFNLRGVTFAARYSLPKAIHDFGEAVRLDPKMVEAFVNRSVAYRELAEYDKASADCESAIHLDPKSAAAYSSRAAIYFEKKEYAKAVADCVTALRLEPSSAHSHALLAWILAACPDASLRDGRKAIEHAVEANILSGWSVGYFHEALAVAHAESGNFPEAVKWQKKAQEFGFDSFLAKQDAAKRLALYERRTSYQLAR